METEVMNATKLTVDWKEHGEVPVFPLSKDGVGHSQSLLTRQISSPNPARCPHCDSIIYSRRNRLCGVCSQALPEEFLFTPREARRVEQILRIEQLRHKQWMHRVCQRAAEFAQFD
jgi:hypothetical protein